MSVTLGPRHWPLFLQLLIESEAIGNLISDAWYAALAIEHGCEWITDDADFTRVPILRWRRPGAPVAQPTAHCAAPTRRFTAPVTSGHAHCPSR